MSKTTLFNLNKIIIYLYHFFIVTSSNLYKRFFTKDIMKTKCLPYKPDDNRPRPKVRNIKELYTSAQEYLKKELNEITLIPDSCLTEPIKFPKEKGRNLAYKFLI